MSADNFIGIAKNPEGEGFIVTHGFMSQLFEDESYIGQQILGPYETNEEATMAAHKRYSKEYIVEYGVITLD
jgi:hypothetical protein